MSKRVLFRSALAEVLQQYIELRVATGRKFKEPIAVLQSLDRFLSQDPKGQQKDLTAETFDAWCRIQTTSRSRVQRWRMFVVRNLCLYRRRTVPACFVPDPALFPAARKYQVVAPYIFSDSEVARLMSAALELKRYVSSPVRPELTRLAIILLYTAGLRHGEMLRLSVSDFDPREGTILIRETKFYKTRVVTLSRNVVPEVEQYLRLRGQHNLPVRPNTPLFSHQRQGGKAYALGGFWEIFQLLLKACNIRTPSGRFPRIHDLRHSCAVNVLVRWYRTKADVQAKLPFLAAYLGHVSITSTYYYLRFVEPLRDLANKRFNDNFGELVRSLSTPTGGANEK